VGAAPLADVPCLPELPRLIRLKYLTDVNRWTALEAPVALLRAVTGDRPEREPGLAGAARRPRPERRGVARPPGPVRLLGLPRPVTHRLGSPLHRRGGEVPVRRRRAADRGAAALPGADLRAGGGFSGPRRAGGPGPVAAARSESPDAGDRRVPEDPGPARGRPLPRALRGLQRGRPAPRRGGRGGPPPTVGAGPLLQRRLADAAGRSHGRRRPGRRRRHRRHLRGDLTGGAVEPVRAGLRAQRPGGELLGHLVVGSDTRRIAQEMFVSEHTVQDHLKSIFAKTGTRNRRTLLTRAVGR
jgi:hypothetical protein